MPEMNAQQRMDMVTSMARRPVDELIGAQALAKAKRECDPENQNLHMWIELLRDALQVQITWAA